jgi:polysaccharide biosynthesis/export protein
MTKKSSVVVRLFWALSLLLAMPAIVVAQASASAISAGDPAMPSVKTGSDSTQSLSAASKARQEDTVAKAKSAIGESNIEEEDAPATPVRSSVHRPLVSRSDFQVFAEDAAGQPLPVFGRNLFEEVPSTFAPMDRIPVPADYAVGPGDELLVRIWGKIDLALHVTVDRNGQIFLPRIGTLNVSGLRYAQLEGFLRSAVGGLYKDFELNVTLGQLRSIQILVLGNARRPGSYTLSSLSTLVDALFESGGPSATGTMRRIQLRRNGQTVRDFDLYDLQQKGDQSQDVPLLSGDEIYIPPIGPQVAIVGSVNQPGIFELKGNATVAAALEGAGGLTNLAGTARALLERVDHQALRRVDEFALTDAGLERTLKDGDVLRIFPISSQFGNAVMLRGNVASPGRFPWHAGMRVSDLIPSRESLLMGSHWSQQNHLADERHPDMMSDLAETNAEINWEYAAIERLDERDLSTRLIPLNLGNAIDNPQSPDNYLLKVGDVLTIFSRKDLPLPLEKHATFVRVGGEVNAPGVYRVNAGDTLRDVVQRAGGVTSHAYLFAAQLSRASARAIQREQLRLSVDRMQKELLAHYANESHPVESPAQAASGSSSDQQARFKMQQALIARLSATELTGRVVLGIKPDARDLVDIPEFPLEDGDSFYIPPRLGTVQVVGEVYNENAFRYQANKTLAAYLNDSGGATRMADVKRIFLIRADGTVVSRQSRGPHWLSGFERTSLMPGDAIVVPQKLKAPGGIMGEMPLITQILSQTAMTGAVLSMIQ